jgi:hypothetical protein
MSVYLYVFSNMFQRVKHVTWEITRRITIINTHHFLHVYKYKSASHVTCYRHVVFLKIVCYKLKHALNYELITNELSVCPPLC